MDFKRKILLSLTIFLFISLLFGRDIILLNSSRDYFYIFSTDTLKVKKKFPACSKYASCTDVISDGKNFFLILHRLGKHQDSNEIRVYNQKMSKLIKIIYVSKSPYRAFMISDDKFLINHTFFDFISKSFLAEILDVKKMGIERKIHLDGIPVGIVKFKNKKSILVEDVRGVIGGVEITNFYGKRKYLFKNKNISSNIVSLGGKYFCAVNHYGGEFKNSLLRIYPLRDSTKIKVLKRFDVPDPIILGSKGSYLFIGFSNHSYKNNYDRFGIYDIKNGEFYEYKVCFGPESLIVLGDKIFIGCVCEEKLAVINLKTFNIKIVEVSDTTPGFSLVRKVY